MCASWVTGTGYWMLQPSIGDLHCRWWGSWRHVWLRPSWGHVRLRIPAREIGPWHIGSWTCWGHVWSLTTRWHVGSGTSGTSTDVHARGQVWPDIVGVGCSHFTLLLFLAFLTHTCSWWRSRSWSTRSSTHGHSWRQVGSDSSLRPSTYIQSRRKVCSGSATDVDARW